jgi:regulator of cell morphogenesis and NO signaling
MTMSDCATAAANDNHEDAWAASSASEIIDFILRRYHESLHRDLPALVASARKVEAETRADPLCPTGLGDHIEQVRLAVEGHLAKEEKILFPLILAGRGHAAFMPVKVMMAEHDDHAANLARTRALCHDFELPGDPAPAWRALYLELRRFEADLRQHIEIENNVLFPRVMGGDGM